MISPELSRAMGKAMKDIRKKSNYDQLHKEMLKAKTIDDLSEECRKIVEKYIDNNINLDK